MPANQYEFVTRWRVRGTVDEAWEVISDAEGLTRWWPSVYLDVRVVEPGGEGGVGRVVDLYTKGWLPYTLRWRFRTTESRRPFRAALEAWGDFVGRGVWTYAQDGDHALVQYEWTVRADKPLLRWLSPLLKPVFSMNHRWAMARGEESLDLELRRRRARTPEERAAVPAPPPPTTTSSVPLVLSLAGTALLAWWLARAVWS